MLKKLYDRDRAAKLVADPSAAMSRYGFRFEEVAKASGIDFTHQAPTLDPKLDHIMPQVASMGAAVSVVDFDRDGWQDIYVTNSGEGSKNCLYRNMGDGTFKDVAAELGLGRCQPGGNRRFDGRGLGRLRQRRLRRPVPLQMGPPGTVSQRRGRSFTRVTEKAGLALLGECQHSDLV